MSSINLVYSAYCKERFPLPSEAAVAELELRLGIPLPPDYRRYLLDYNGAAFTDPRLTLPTEDCPSDRLTVMAGFNATHPSVELGKPGGFTPACFDDNDPPQLLPIGYTITGNLIFMVCEPGAEDCGAISLKLASSDKVYFLASGIEEFFSRIVEAERLNPSGPGKGASVNS